MTPLAVFPNMTAAQRGDRQPKSPDRTPSDWAGFMPNLGAFDADLFRNWPCERQCAENQMGSCHAGG